VPAGPEPYVSILQLGVLPQNLLTEVPSDICIVDTAEQAQQARLRWLPPAGCLSAFFGRPAALAREIPDTPPASPNKH